MEIGDWLRGLGLGRYADAFRAGDVGLDVLPSLTDADLRELGVSLGNRRRLRKAALALKGQVGQIRV
ncbi:MAG: SAM domain-containing protein, partial [Geminicoccaceae bacterium]